MKKEKWLLLITIVGFSIVSCEKNASQVTKIQVSKDVLKVGEVLAVQISNAQSGSVSRWSVEPAGNSTVEHVFTTGTNTLTFTKPGNYVIGAEMRTVHPDCRPSPNWDTCFFNGSDPQKLATTITVK